MYKLKSDKFIFLLFAVLTYLNPSLANTVTQTRSNELLKSYSISGWNNFTNAVKDNEDFTSNTYSSQDIADKTLDSIDENNNLSISENKIEYQNQLQIQSDSQSERNNVLYAEGNVLVTFKANKLQANKLIYDKKTQVAFASGEIVLKIGDQLFLAEEIEYDFLNEKGLLKNVKGFVNLENLLTNFDFNIESDSENLSIEDFINKEKILHTPDGVNNWIFTTTELEIADNIWSSEKAYFTNDLLGSNQIKFEVNSLKIYSQNDKFKFSSSLNYLVLEEKVSLPFWFGERTFHKSDSSFDFANRWNLGYDKIDRDGYFLGRRFNPIEISENFILNIEPQYLLQRSINGYTNSYVEKDTSITSDKVRQNTEFLDYLAFKSIISGDINNWDLVIENELSSLDTDKFLNALRSKIELSKEITLFKSEWNNKLSAVYRDRIWNGSIGESEIYAGYSWIIDKQNNWEVDGVSKSEKVVLGLGNFKAEALNSEDLLSSIKGGMFYQLDIRIPISSHKPTSDYVDRSYEYIPKPIEPGIFLNTKTSILYNIYENGNSQQYMGFGAGPEFVFGKFKNKYFDYTRFSFLPFYRFKSGDSIFKFDQVSEGFTLDMEFDQHLIGPLLIRSSGKLNLDTNSENYGEFINSRVSLSWSRRSYEIGLYYQPHNQAGGLLFSIFGFE